MSYTAPSMSNPAHDLLATPDPSLYDIATHAPGPQGSLPITPEMLLTRPSGDLFGWSQNAGMGWNPALLGGKEFLILSTHGGIRAADGTPIALGYHTGHWEVGLLMEAAAKELAANRAIPFAAYCTDPCDGRTQGTTGMFDSLAYRNDAATVFQRLIRSLPTRRGVLGVATCDKGLPAMMMALAGTRTLPCVLIPGGVTLQAEAHEDAGKVQSAGARFSRGQMTLEDAAEELCHACASPGGGCQFLGTAATAQVVGEALGMSLPHSALAPSGQPIWLDMARRSARAVLQLEAAGTVMSDILTDASVRNALVIHAAFGGSTNLILHLPAIAHPAGLSRPTVDDWTRINRQDPRLVDALPNGPVGHPTVQVFLAGGVPEVMLHLRRAGLLETKALTVSGLTLDEILDWWQDSERRAAVRRNLQTRDGIDPDRVIMSPDAARRAGLTSTVTFPKGNLAPGGSVIKSTSIDPSVLDADGIYRKTGPARVFRSREGRHRRHQSRPHPGRRRHRPRLPRPHGLRHGRDLRHHLRASLSRLRQARRCPHRRPLQRRLHRRLHRACRRPKPSPEVPSVRCAKATISEIVIDRVNLTGSVNLAPNGDHAEGARLLAERQPENLHADADLPPETRLWAALQDASGGTWGGCVFDVDAIAERLQSGRKL